ncbi:hypothetical protein SAMN05444000_102206 [Shimia gijangensis]|uniref:Repeat domain-containing protein n=1 Tax=Shimia gijangensis TaxID=1470563 RepID=A0A1M6D225_9RHOB|nr:VCBS repeat-containing protein [Shimia gijangensis]SHI67171.1 hypothetical protein SAMN05444000_102206 [Shimia gijangensis]
MLAEARRLVLRLWWACARRARTGACVWLALIALTAPVWADIVSARYMDPTTRYDHGILGDAVEYGALEMQLQDGRRLRLALPETSVFEDLEPRLIDLNGDGALEIITIESSLTKGARLAIYGEDGLIAATPHIGRTHRWLAPLGAADLDGDGKIEVAYIDRPHLARILRIWRFDEGKLVHLSDTPGLTNHRIGQDYISGGIRDCGAVPEIVTVNADWGRIIATTFDGKRTKSRDIGSFQGRSSLAKAATTCSN